ncbi:Gfo/Idh/MocA family protein [Streptomyces sp. NEAU-Y11]|uniref:Gfo/Idh/MocA family protein n=1 Tax=Streptomyces cucumeris TaxID=2962890 RepID=UPI0020C93543|nr:Gfo/Idh/MocA family oxidoreductase [Streptomyces sp. NEAU-Y11]MCP9212193.1 Gfo/Idh/MocA family oxidoreductase [Streptomyces sp. NEAU-Y11]
MLRFGIIGRGSIGGFLGRLLTRRGQPLHGRARLAGVACRDPGRAAAWAAELGCPAGRVADLLARPDVDAVVVCTPSGTHGELAAAALEAGKHVLVEKPLEVTADAAERLLTVAARYPDRTLGVVSQRRFDPAARLVKAAVDGGELGRITSVLVELPWWRGQRYYSSGSWRGTRGLDGGGALMNQAVHTLDLVQWLAGPVAEVAAHTALLAHRDIEVEDVATASLRFTGGALGTVLATTAAYPGRTARIAVHGDRGSAVIDNDELVWFHAAAAGEEAADFGAYGEGDQAAERLARHPGADRDPERDPIGLLYQPHHDQVMDFVDAVADGRPPLVDAVAGWRAVSAVTAVYESSRTGAPVRLPPRPPSAGAAGRPAAVNTAAPAERTSSAMSETLPPTAASAERKAALASLFDRSAPTYERVGVTHFDDLGRRLVEHAGIRAGERVLDVGCGTGAVLLPAARAAAGPGGEAVGVDLSPGMVARARERVAEAGLDNARAHTGDAETVEPGASEPSVTGGFDAVLAGISMFFFVDPVAAMVRYRELLNDGGRLALSWWGRPDPRWDAVFRASAPYGGLSAHRLPEDSPFLSEDALHTALEKAGYRSVRTLEESCVTRFVGRGQWWRWVWSTAGRQFWESVPEDAMEKATAAVDAELTKLMAPDGSLTSSSVVRFTVARTD